MHKKQVSVECPECEKKIVGFSERHAQQNLLIHEKTSQFHENVVRLARKLAKKFVGA